jgi:glycosyltransferase involved in cell wall biosynthesis
VAADVAIPHFRGSSTHVYEVAKNLVKLGNEVHVVSRRVSSTQKGEEKMDGMIIHRFFRGILIPPKRSSFLDVNTHGSYRGSTPRLLWKSYEVYLKTIFPTFIGMQVAKLVKELAIDVILERETSFGAGAIASIITQRPFVLEVIGNRVTSLQLERSAKIIVYSHSILEGLEEKARVAEVTGAVDTEMFSPDPQGGTEIRQRYHLDDRPVIGYVGTFQEWHGLKTLIEAAGLVVGQITEARFFMVGPYFTETKNSVKKAGLEDSFIFTGPVPYDMVPKFMNACDILVAPYDPTKIRSSEQVRTKGLGSPLKVFEYMAVGKPTITTNVQPISDPIKNGSTGILVKPGDSAGLGERILELLRDREQADRMGCAARAAVIANYSWNLVARRIQDILLSAACRNDTRPIQQNRENPEWTRTV